MSVIIGVAGGTGSGKTTVASALMERVGEETMAWLQHDAYYRDRSHLPPEERGDTNFDHPDALETELLVEQLEQLQDGDPVEVPIYDFTRHVRTHETITVPPRPVILVEGILVLAEDALRETMDVKIYVDTAPDIRFIRRLRRDLDERGRSLESVVSQYLDEVRPMHLEFVEPSKRHADVIVPEGGFNRVALGMLVDRIEQLAAADAGGSGA